MDHHHSDDNSEIVTVDPGDPHNDQMLAEARDTLRAILDATIHPLIDQAEQQNAGLASMMAALCLSWIEREDQMPREQAITLLALLMFIKAKDERAVVAYEKTERRRSL